MIRNSKAIGEAFRLDDGVGIFKGAEGFDDVEGVAHELAHWLALRAPLGLLDSSSIRIGPEGGLRVGFSAALSDYLKEKMPPLKSRRGDHNEAQAQAIVMLLLGRMRIHAFTDRPFHRMFQYAARHSLGKHSYDEKWLRKTVRRYRRQPCIKALADQLFHIFNHPEVLGIDIVDT